MAICLYQIMKLHYFEEDVQKQRPEIFYKNAVLKIFAIFIGKRLCWSIFLIKFQTFRPAILLKRDSNKSGFL